MLMALATSLATSLVVLFIAELLQIFRQNFYSNTSCFSLLWLDLGNSQVSVYRTVGPTLVCLPLKLTLRRKEKAYLYLHVFTPNPGPHCMLRTITRSTLLSSSEANLKKKGEDILISEPGCEKTSFQDFRPGLTQTRL